MIAIREDIVLLALASIGFLLYDHGPKISVSEVIFIFQIIFIIVISLYSHYIGLGF